MYSYDTSYEPMCNVSIVTGASRYMNINTGRSFIIVINEALYYGKKLGHYLINPNQLQSYMTMFWDKPFDFNREICVENEDGYTIDLIVNGENIGFDSTSPTDHEFQSLPHAHLTSKFQWNPKTVHHEEVRAKIFETKYIACQCKELGYTEKGDYQYQDPNTDE